MNYLMALFSSKINMSVFLLNIGSKHSFSSLLYLICWPILQLVAGCQETFMGHLIVVRVLGLLYLHLVTSGNSRDHNIWAMGCQCQVGTKSS